MSETVSTLKEIAEKASADKKAEATKAAIEKTAAAAERARQVGGFLSSKGFRPQMLRDLSASELKYEAIYGEDYPDGGSRVVDSRYVGEFTAKLSEYENLSLSGSYEETEIAGIRVIARKAVRIPLLGIKLHYKISYYGFDGIAAFIEKHGVLAAKS